MDAPQPDPRVSVSLSQLRAELTAMELRIVDRLNGALANKADRQIQEQLSQRVSDYGSRIAALEGNVVKKDGPVATMVAAHDLKLVELASVGNYKKWLWVQGVALVGVTIPALAYVVDKLTT